MSTLHFLARITAPLARPLAGRRGITVWAVVLHEGRRSGNAYATPVAVSRTPDGFMIPITFGEGTQWTKNVLAAGGCRLRWSGHEYRLVDPQVVDRATGALAFNGPERAALSKVRIETFLHLREAPVA